MTGYILIQVHTYYNILSKIQKNQQLVLFTKFKRLTPLITTI